MMHGQKNIKLQSRTSVGLNCNDTDRQSKAAIHVLEAKETSHYQSTVLLYLT